MNELQRQQYLDAMGVDTYMPRWVLPHAPAPVACDVSFIPVELEAGLPQGAVKAGNQAKSKAASNDAAAPVAPAAGVSAGASAKPESVLAALTEPVTSVEAAVEQVQSADKPSAKTPVNDEPVPQFALSIWRVSEQLLVIDSRQAQLALPTEPLLINILVALGYPRKPLPKAEVIRWPMVDNPFVGQSAADAREMLEAYLDGKLLTHPAKHILLMGEDACRYVLPEVNSVEDQLGKVVALEHHKVDAIVVPSLSTMLLEPEQKRLTWKAIQPLILSSVEAD
jgi:hypothetical protein